MTLLEAIPFGQLSAVNKTDLARELGWYTDYGQPDTRRVEREIQALRIAGKAAICANGRGYWQPATSDEYAANIDSRRRRAVRQLVTVRGERRYVRAWQAREARPLVMPWSDAA